MPWAGSSIWGVTLHFTMGLGPLDGGGGLGGTFPKVEFTR